ncbi:MAG: hypothetical protein K2X74_08450 [Acetobacteraceae bacterium]|nr:hypothetical protein [Acetobacteraceae bacterium]
MPQARVRAVSSPGTIAFGWYLALLLPANLAWEAAQLPLYTIWTEANARAIAFAVLHCTVADGMIGAVSLAAALILLQAHGWPARGAGRVAAVTTAVGVGYTVFSEWLNVEVRGAWAYAEAMPRLPPLGTGLAPVLQWLVLPPLALLGARGLAQWNRHPNTDPTRDLA